VKIIDMVVVSELAQTWRRCLVKRDDNSRPAAWSCALSWAFATLAKPRQTRAKTNGERISCPRVKRSCNWIRDRCVSKNFP
jgi:hypothetical protein